MTRHVRGILFVDCVRIIRAFKEVEWTRYLLDEDTVWLTQEVDPQEWYPMGSYERMGLAIMQTVAGGSLSLIRRWGRDTARTLQGRFPELIADSDPAETLRRFDGLRDTLFDFPAYQSHPVRDGEVDIDLDYGMGRRAEEAACEQSMGVIEQLLELSGATKVAVEPTSRSWAGAEKTVLRARWRLRW